MNELNLTGGLIFIVGNLLWLRIILGNGGNRYDRWRIYKEDFTLLYWAKIKVGRFWGFDIYRTYRKSGSRYECIYIEDLKEALHRDYLNNSKKSRLVEER